MTPGGKRASLRLCDQTQAPPSSGTGSVTAGATSPPLACLEASPLPSNSGVHGAQDAVTPVKNG